MAALTWKNIDAPDLRGVGLLTEQAGRSLNAGFDNFTNIIKERNKVEDANWNQGKENNIAALRSLVQGARTAEEYDALMKSGQIDAMQKQFGAQIDPNAAFKLIDERLGSLQQRDKAKIDYENTRIRDLAAPLFSQVKADVVNGDYTKARTLLPQFDERLRGEAAALIAAQEDQDRVKAQQAVKLEEDLRNSASTRDVNASTITRNNAAAAQDNANARKLVAALDDPDSAEGTGKVDKQSKAAEALLKKVLDQSQYKEGHLGTLEGWNKFTKGVHDSVKDKTDAENIIREFAKRYRSGIQVPKVDEQGKPVKDASGKPLFTTLPVPVATAVQHASGARSHMWNNRWSNTGIDAADTYHEELTRTAQELAGEWSAIEEAQTGARIPLEVGAYKQIGKALEKAERMGMPLVNGNASGRVPVSAPLGAGVLPKPTPTTVGRPEGVFNQGMDPAAVQAALEARLAIKKASEYATKKAKERGDKEERD